MVFVAAHCRETRQGRWEPSRQRPKSVVGSESRDYNEAEILSTALLRHCKRVRAASGLSLADKVFPVDLLELNVLGMFRMIRGGQTLTEAAPDRARALLTFLALEGAQSRNGGHRNH